MVPAIVIALLLLIAAPASAQFGIPGLLKKADNAESQADQWLVTDEEEVRIGSAVSEKLRQRFGVVQNVPLHKYVTLVGMMSVRDSARPTLPWTFIVLDTDGVNAFAAPGGFIHVTRGLLGLVTNEAQLASVLAHEAGHVLGKHAINALRKSKAVNVVTDKTVKDRSQVLDMIADRSYALILENNFDRADETDSDTQAVALAAKAGYAPTALAEFLAHLDERNQDQPQRNGLFASHPETKGRIDKIQELAKTATARALVAPRYDKNVDVELVAIENIASDEPQPVATSGSSRFGLSKLKKVVKAESSSNQVTASGGARGVGADRYAKGGDKPAAVKVTVTDTEVTDFKKGIA